MEIEKYEILKQQNKTLMKMLDEIIDYSTCMKMATGYTTGNDPNILAMCRFLDRAKKENL